MSILGSKRRNKIGEYDLHKYHWRSLATFVGPLLVLAFYGYIGFYYLRRPPVNGIIPSSPVGDARWAFYLWFIVAIFALELGRVALANIEAAALMRPRLAPRTASQLMWHVDAKWSNPLWWARFILYASRWFWKRQKAAQHQVTDAVPLPSKLWVLLSLVSALLFTVIPLSGLSMEISQVSVYGDTKAQLYGPDATSFNSRYTDDLSGRIYQNWISGRTTTPPTGSIFYAPEKTENVSESYFDDQIWSDAVNVETFSGPEVHEQIVGTVWGVFANISCRPTPPPQLQMMKVENITNYQINACVVRENATMNPADCHLSWLSTSSSNTTQAWPAWLQEAVYTLWATYQFVSTTSLAVADGVSDFDLRGTWSFTDGGSLNTGTGGNRTESQYSNKYGHDGCTFDSLQSNRSGNDRTNSMFELFLWQTLTQNVNRQDLAPLLAKWPTAIYQPVRSEFAGNHPASLNSAIGFGIHCDIDSAVGTASVDPITRTFSQFRLDPAARNQGSSGLYDGQISPVQVLALGALSINQTFGSIYRPLKPRYATGPYTGYSNELLSSTVTSIYRALNHPFPDLKQQGADVFASLLSPKDVQQAVYKLLGESVIAMTGASGLTPWYGDAYGLDSTRYLVSGVFPWTVVFAILALWAVVVSAGALWLAFYTGPRWSPTLDGFEMFKFGAQYHDEVNAFEDTRFEGCTPSLSRIPGMVGLLPGTGHGPVRSDLEFIGLSENVVTDVSNRTGNSRFTLDRTKAAKVRLH